MSKKFQTPCGASTVGLALTSPVFAGRDKGVSYPAIHPSSQDRTNVFGPARIFRDVSGDFPLTEVPAIGPGLPRANGSNGGAADVE